MVHPLLLLSILPLRLTRPHLLLLPPPSRPRCLGRHRRPPLHGAGQGSGPSLEEVLVLELGLPPAGKPMPKTSLENRPRRPPLESLRRRASPARSGSRFS